MRLIVQRSQAIELKNFDGRIDFHTLFTTEE